MAKIIIKRKKSVVCSFIKFDVYLMNTYLGVLKSGSKLEAEVPIGCHQLFFKQQKEFNKKKETVCFSAVVNEENEVVELKTYFKNTGDIVARFFVEYADNAPHIPQFQSATPGKDSEDITPDVSRTTLFCPRCGGHNLTPLNDISTKGKDFKSGDACCGALLFGPLGLLCGFTGKGKQASSETFWLCSDCGNKFKAP